MFGLIKLYRDVQGAEGSGDPIAEIDLSEIFADNPIELDDSGPVEAPEGDSPAKDETTQPASGPDPKEPETPQEGAINSDDQPPEKDKAGQEDKENMFGFDLNTVPESLRPTLDNVVKGFKREYTKKTTALAEERKKVESLAGYADRSADLGNALQFFDYAQKDPVGAAKYLQGLSGAPEEAPPAQPAQNPPPNEPQGQGNQGNPDTTVYDKLEKLGFTPEAIDLLSQLADEKASAQVTPLAQNMYEKIVKPYEADKNLAGLSQIQNEVNVMSSNSKEYPYFEHLKPAIGKALSSNPGLNSPVEVYKSLVETLNLEKLVDSVSLTTARDLEKEKAGRNGSFIQNPRTNTGSGADPMPEDVGDFINKVIADNGGWENFNS